VHEVMARLVRLLTLPASEMSAFENPRSADWSAVEVVQRQHGSPSSSPLDWPSPSVSAWQSALVQANEAAWNALANLSRLAWPVFSPRTSPLGTRAMYSRRAEAGVAASARRRSAEAGAGLAGLEFSIIFRDSWFCDKIETPSEAGCQLGYVKLISSRPEDLRFGFARSETPSVVSLGPTNFHSTRIFFYKWLIG